MTRKLLKAKLALFFSLGYSLRGWEDTGLIDREIAPYNRLAEYLDSIYFFTYGDEGDLQYQGTKLKLNIKVLPQKIDLPPLLYSFLLPWIYRDRLQEVDILKTNQIGGSWAAVLAKWLFGKKLIVRCGYQQSLFLKHHAQTRPFHRRQAIQALALAYSIAEWIAYKSANAIILATEADKQYVVKRYGISAEKITIIPNYIDTEHFKPMDDVEVEENRICCVARLTPQKNLAMLLEAIRGLNVKLVIFGDGPLRGKLEKQAKCDNLNVSFAGRIPNERVPYELRRSELFVLPSRYEGNPKALLEAMACGLPVIGTNVPGIREVIKHRWNGYLCESTASSIRAAIQSILANKDLAAEMGQNARRYVMENYSLESLLKREIALLARLVS